MRVQYTSSASQINNFLQNLNEYLDSGRYCDLTFIVNDTHFPCHRIILASSSPYFQALLTDGFRENNLNYIELHDIEPRVFSILLHYIYSGKIEIDNNNVQDILISSDMFQLDEVVEFCCRYLSISLNETNAVDIWKIADELRLASLRDEAEHYMITNFHDLTKINIIQNIPVNLLIKIISNDDLRIDDEQEVLDAILRWYCHNLEGPFERLCDNVRLEHISKEQQRNILHKIGFENPSIIRRIEQIITNRECRITSSPPRRGMKQTFYLIGGYGSSENDTNSHLLTSPYRCHLNITDSLSSSFSIQVEPLHEEEMRYPRMHHQVAALGGLIYIVGGEDGDNIFNSVEVFDPSSKDNNDKWRQGNSMITPRCNFGLIAYDSTTLYALGGHIGADLTSSIEIFNSKTSQWTLLPYKLQSPCYGFACALLNGLILCIGGSCIYHIPVKTTEIFNPRTGQSYLCTDMNQARTLCSVCVDDEQEKVYVFGGADSNGNGLRSVEVYNSLNCRWYTLPSMLFSRISPSVYRMGYHIFVFGGRTSLGQNADILNTTEVYHIEKKTWIRANDIPIHVYGAATVLR